MSTWCYLSFRELYVNKVLFVFDGIACQHGPIRISYGLFFIMSKFAMIIKNIFFVGYMSMEIFLSTLGYFLYGPLREGFSKEKWFFGFWLILENHVWTWCCLSFIESHVHTFLSDLMELHVGRVRSLFYRIIYGQGLVYIL